MKIKKIFTMFAAAFVFSAVLTSCQLFSKSPNMSDYVIESKTPKLTKFEEFKLTTYGFSHNARIVGNSGDTYIVHDSGMYGLLNPVTKKATTAKYSSATAAYNYQGVVIVSKSVENESLWGVANENIETDFTATDSYSVSVTSTGMIVTPKAYYQLKDAKINLLVNRNDHTSFAYELNGTRYLTDDFLINLNTNSLGSIITFKKLEYQHTFVLNDYVPYYIGEGKFIIQKSIYISDDLHNVSDYDYLDSGSAYKLVTNIYDAKTNKVSKCSINEPIASVTRYTTAVGAEAPSYVTIPEKEAYLINTYLVQNKVMDDYSHITRLFNSDLKVLANVTEGDKVMIAKIDDLTSYVDSTGMFFVKNGEDDLIFAGAPITDILNNSVVFGKNIGYETLYGAITPNGTCINATFDKLIPGPNALFGEAEGEYYRIDFDGKKTKIFDVIDLHELFYVREYSSHNDIISYANEGVKLSFNQSLTYDYITGSEALVVELESGSDVFYYVGTFTS